MHEGGDSDDLKMEASSAHLPPAQRLCFPVMMNLLQKMVAPSGGRMGPVLLRSTPSLGFPAADVTALRKTETMGPFAYEADIAFLRLYGSSSPLPLFWTERALGDETGARALRDVLDLFGHVIAELLYQSWVHYRPHVFFDRRDPKQLASLLLAPCGIDVTALEDEDCRRLMRVIPLLWGHDRSALILEKVLSTCLDVPVRIEEGCLRYIELPSEARFTLGTTQVRLGQGLRLGTKIGDISTTLAVVLGPLPLAQFEDALYGGSLRGTLYRLLQIMLREPLACRIDLVLASLDESTFVLGKSRLGWTSWIDPSGDVRCQTGLAQF